ncbi:hypothetical protein C8R47DRAFT_1212056 [Mycena vitilis]|nr:hypothetical protein C8R47DRAFT_1212056 [Mycena vitilis]
MPKPEILHSGQYWQDLHRRVKDARTARAAREAQAELFSPTLVDGTEVFTFVPGRAQPYTSVLHPSGRLMPIHGTSQSAEETREVARLASERKRRYRANEKACLERTRKLNQKAHDSDAELVARLRAGNRQALDERRGNEKKGNKSQLSRPS